MNNYNLTQDRDLLNGLILDHLVGCKDCDKTPCSVVTQAREVRDSYVSLRELLSAARDEGDHILQVLPPLFNRVARALLGVDITDWNSLPSVAQQLVVERNTLRQQLDEAKKQLDEAKKQLDEAKKQSDAALGQAFQDGWAEADRAHAPQVSPEVDQLRHEHTQRWWTATPLQRVLDMATYGEARAAVTRSSVDRTVAVTLRAAAQAMLQVDAAEKEMEADALKAEEKEQAESVEAYVASPKSQEAVPAKVVCYVRVSVFDPETQDWKAIAVFQPASLAQTEQP